MIRILFSFVLVLSLLSISCGDSGAGAECTNNYGCDSGLVCSAGQCITDAASGDPNAVDSSSSTPQEEESSTGGETSTEEETSPEEETSTEEESSTEEEPGESPEAGDTTGPVVTFVSPEAYEMIQGQMTLRFSVSDESGVNLDSIEATVEGVGVVELNAVADYTFEAAVETSGLADGLIFPLILVTSQDLLGNASQYARRFGVDNRIAVATSVSSNQVTAGSEVGVSCSVSRGVNTLQGVDTLVSVNPSVANLVQSTLGASFSPTGVGTYRVSCATADGAVVDTEGKQVQVSAGAAARVDTVIAEPQGKAGDRLGVECRAFDVHDNPIISPQGLSLEASAQVGTQALGGQLFSVSAEAVGTYEVACVMGTVVDLSPAQIIIAPGTAALSTTLVSANGGAPVTELSASPTDEITVHCSATDAYGNDPGDITTHFSIQPADGASYATYGVSYLSTGFSATKTGFSATKTGYIYVICGVDGAAAEDDTPARVKIEAGKPYRWNLNPGAGQNVLDLELASETCHWANRPLSIDAEVTDFWGNPLPSQNLLTVTTTPPGGVIQDANGGFRLAEDGSYGLTVEVVGPYHPESQISAYTGSFVVDSTAPVITITSPTRGAAILGGTAGAPTTDATVAITGTIEDSVSSLKSAKVNGVSLSMDGQAKQLDINQSHLSRWGLSVMTAEAEDECGNFGYAAQSYLRSPSYYEPATSVSAGATASKGITARLNKPVIDDEDRSDVDDLASLAVAAVNAQDLNDQIPDELTDTIGSKSCDCWPVSDITTEDDGVRVTKTGVLTHDDIALAYLRPVDGGVELSGSMSNISMPLRFRGVYHEGCFLVCTARTILSLERDVQVSVSSVNIEANPSISLNGQSPDVSCNSCISLGINNLVLDVDWGGWPWDDLFDPIVTWVKDYFEDSIVEALEEMVSDGLLAVLDDFLGSFQISEGISVGEANDPLQLDLMVASGLDTLEFHGPAANGYADIGLYTQVYPQQRAASIPPDAKGAIRKDGVAPNFSNSGGYEFGLGLKDDLVNQVLWAAWYGGAFTIPEAEDLIGDDLGDIELSFEALSPPVLMPASGGSNQVELGLGDAKIDATVVLPEFGALSVSMYLSAIIGGEINIEAGENASSGGPAQQLSVSLDTTNPEIWLEITDIGESGLQGQMSVLFTQVMKNLVPQLVGSIVTAIPLPTFDVGGMAGLPQAEVWELQNGSLSRESDYYRLTGSLGGDVTN